MEYRKCCYHLSPGRAREMSAGRRQEKVGAARINSTLLGQSLDSFPTTAPKGQNVPGMIARRGKDYSLPVRLLNPSIISSATEQDPAKYTLSPARCAVLLFFMFLESGSLRNSVISFLLEPWWILNPGFQAGHGMSLWTALIAWVLLCDLCTVEWCV